MYIDDDLVSIITNELGKNSADLFKRFCGGFTKREQLDSARELLVLTVGVTRAIQLLKGIEKEQ